MEERAAIEENQAFFGPLYRFVSDPNITDIDFVDNNGVVWLTDTSNNRFSEPVEGLTHAFVEEFSVRIANTVSLPFHKQRPILEAETDTLRVTIVHESVSIGGRAVSIRKSLPAVRLSEKMMMENGYADRDTIELLKNAVKARCNIVFCGEPGVGKTECAKFFGQFIPDKERIVTIEDTPEWHFSSILPNSDVVELRLNGAFDYTQAIKTSLRLNPRWMMVSEVRSKEAVYLIESLSTGVRGITTLHTDDVRNIPDRILNMTGKEQSTSHIENDVYNFMDIGVLLRRTDHRYIDQICCFERRGGMNYCHMILDEGKRMGKLPAGLLQKFSLAGIRVDIPEKKIPEIDFSGRRATYIGERQII